MKSITYLVLGRGSVYGVRIEERKCVGHLKKAIKENHLYTFPADELTLYLAKKDGKWLTKADPDLKKLKNGQVPIGIHAILQMKENQMNPWYRISHSAFQFPSDDQVRGGECHVLVALPRRLDPLTLLPKLEAADELFHECASIETWEVGVVHEIPRIWDFMKDVGGCTATGKLFWRVEEQALVSLLLNSWSNPSGEFEQRYCQERSCVLVGSPGVGKSTLLCVLALVVALVHKKHVLLYRKLGEVYSLLLLGCANGEVYYEKKATCTSKDALQKYSELVDRCAYENVWLMLDGFEYGRAPEGLGGYKILTASMQTDLKSQDRDYSYECLYPCWKLRDLRLLGKLVYGWDAAVVQQRFYLSGGSVREFARSYIGDTKRVIHNAVNRVEDAALLLSPPLPYWHDELCHTFVRKLDPARPVALLYCTHWKFVIDSEFAVELLSKRANDMEQIA